MLRGKKYIKIIRNISMVVLVLLIIILALIFFGFFTSRDKQVMFGKSHSFEFEGQTRVYRSYTPKDVGSNPKMVLVFHGLGSNSFQMAYISALHNSVDKNTIVIYPDATKSSKPHVLNGFNAGFCCGSGWVDQVNDVGYVKKILADVGARPSNTYVAGFSNGGMFVQRLAAEEPSLFAGFASVSGNIGTKGNELKPTKAVPMLLIHGDQDLIVPFNGGAGGPDAKFNWSSFSETSLAWQTANKASDPKTNENKTAIINSYGVSEKPLETIVYKGKGHTWPGWRLLKPWHKKPEGSSKIVKFFGI